MTMMKLVIGEADCWIYPTYSRAIISGRYEASYNINQIYMTVSYPNASKFETGKSKGYFRN